MPRTWAAEHIRAICWITLRSIKEVGYKNVMVDTDGGQTEIRTGSLQFEEYMQYLLDHGIPEEQVYHMTRTIPAGLLGI